MLRPLNKHNRSGYRYTRLASIEAAIKRAIDLDPAPLIERAAIRDWHSSDYIPSECLVHLLRKARREGKDILFNQLFPHLLNRCEATLINAVNERSVPDAAGVREEILGQLAELFAQDGTGANPDELDFYEVRFNCAFKALRIDVIRDVQALAGHPAALQPMEEEHEAEFAPGCTLSGEEIFFQLEVQEAINVLPPDERRVVTLHRILGYEIESTDPAKRTVASICGITGRSVRNRLRRADERLKRLKEEP